MNSLKEKKKDLRTQVIRKVTQMTVYDLYNGECFISRLEQDEFLGMLKNNEIEPGDKIIVTEHDED